MKILIYGLNYFPELTGIGKYTGEMASWLADQGHEIRVVTAPPYYPHWCVDPSFTNFWQVGYKNNIKVYRCPLWVPVRPSGLKRILHLASFTLTSLPVMLSQIVWKPDVVWVVEPPLFSAPVAWLLARLSGAKVWMHIQDFEVDAAFDLGILKGELLNNWALLLERVLLARFDRVSTISQKMVERLNHKGVTGVRCSLFPNWVDVRALSSAQAINSCDFRKVLGIANDAIVVLYSGNMGNKQGLEILPKVAELLIRETHIVMVLCGNGAGREALLQLSAHLSNIRFLDLQPYECLPALLAMADIHLLPQRADAADLVMPSKLTGMLASARPVVATADVGTELASVVNQCGFVVPPDDSEACAEAILKLSLDSVLRKEFANNGLNYARQYLDRDSVLKNFEHSLKDLVN